MTSIFHVAFNIFLALQGDEPPPDVTAEERDRMLRAVIQTAVDTIKHRKDQQHQGKDSEDGGETGVDKHAPQHDNLGQFVELNLATARSSRKPSTTAVSTTSEQAHQDDPMEQDDTPTEEEVMASFNPKIVLEKVDDVSPENTRKHRESAKQKQMEVEESAEQHQSTESEAADKPQTPEEETKDDEESPAAEIPVVVVDGDNETGTTDKASTTETEADLPSKGSVKSAKRMQRGADKAVKELTDKNIPEKLPTIAEEEEDEDEGAPAEEAQSPEKFQPVETKGRQGRKTDKKKQDVDREDHPRQQRKTTENRHTGEEETDADAESSSPGKPVEVSADIHTKKSESKRRKKQRSANTASDILTQKDVSEKLPTNDEVEEETETPEEELDEVGRVERSAKKKRKQSDAEPRKAKETAKTPAKTPAKKAAITTQKTKLDKKPEEEEEQENLGRGGRSAKKKNKEDVPETKSRKDEGREAA